MVVRLTRGFILLVLSPSPPLNSRIIPAYSLSSGGKGFGFDATDIELQRRPARPHPFTRRRMGDACVISVPYSEHCSYGELRRCVDALKPRRVVPTVGNTEVRAGGTPPLLCAR